MSSELTCDNVCDENISFVENSICSTEITEKDLLFFNSINSLLSTEEEEVARGLYKTDLLWKHGYTMKIGFTPDSVALTSIAPPEYDSDPLYTSIFADIKSAKTPQGKLDKQIDSIKRIINERFAPVCRSIKFVFVDNSSDAEIRIKLDPTNGTWSYIGTGSITTSDAEPSITFGWFSMGTVLHEFAHVMGMIHEHQKKHSIDVPWNVERVYKYFTCPPNNWTTEMVDENILNINKQHDLSEEYLNSNFYDPLSIMVYFIPDCLVCGQGAKPNRRFSGMDVMWLAKYYDTEDLKVSVEDQRLVPSTYLNNLFQSWYGITINDSFKQIVQARQEYLKQLVDPVGPCENPRYIEVATKFSDKKADIVDLVNNPSANAKQDLQTILSSPSTTNANPKQFMPKLKPQTVDDQNLSDVSWAAKHGDVQVKIPDQNVADPATAAVANDTSVSSDNTFVDSVRDLQLGIKLFISGMVWLVSFAIVSFANRECSAENRNIFLISITHSMLISLFATAWMYDCDSIKYVLVGIGMYALYSLVIFMNGCIAKKVLCENANLTANSIMTVLTSLILTFLNVYMLNTC
jgi:hypothetical protein